MGKEGGGDFTVVAHECIFPAARSTGVTERDLTLLIHDGRRRADWPVRRDLQGMGGRPNRGGAYTENLLENRLLAPMCLLKKGVFAAAPTCNVFARSVALCRRVHSGDGAARLQEHRGGLIQRFSDCELDLDVCTAASGGREAPA